MKSDQVLQNPPRTEVYIEMINGIRHGRLIGRTDVTGSVKRQRCRNHMLMIPSCPGHTRTNSVNPVPLTVFCRYAGDGALRRGDGYHCWPFGDGTDLGQHQPDLHYRELVQRSDGTGRHSKNRMASLSCPAN